MKESPFVEIFKNAASKVAGENLVVRKGSNLLYQIQLNKKLELLLSENDLKTPKRGSSAFQTDICIFEKIENIELPRVVIEFKTNITTHDIITYSSKAGKHKGIYPYLRYGLLMSEIESIPKRVFIHNEHLDFILAARKYKDGNSLNDFVKNLIEQEIEVSKTLEAIHFENKKYDYYRTGIIFKNFGKE